MVTSMHLKVFQCGNLEVEKALNEAGFEVQTRGEKLSIEDFCTLSKALYKYNPPVSGKEA